MKRFMVIFFVMSIGFSVFGCGKSANISKMQYQSEKRVVFTEVKGDENIPKGFSDLIIKADIKTHLKGYYILESSKSSHGKDEYPFLLKIDGETEFYKVKGVIDSKQLYDKEGRASLDPEAGDGVKYILEKRLRLTAGTHKITFTLPEEGYSTETEITLKEGIAHYLEFRPLYGYKKLPIPIRSFFHGINKYEVYFDRIRHREK